MTKVRLFSPKNIQTNCNQNNLSSKITCACSSEYNYHTNPRRSNGVL